MKTLPDLLLIAWKWTLSFRTRSWDPADYPIRARRQGGVSAEAGWFARVLNWPGPVGLGATRHEARSALLANLTDIRSYREQHNEAMPRPGASVPIQFASNERVAAHPALLADFIEHVLGFSPSAPVFVSDLSSLGDFDSAVSLEAIQQRIHERYHFSDDLHASTTVAAVLERIAAQTHEV